jgi:uncharacterized protein (DUF302 family)
MGRLGPRKERDMSDYTLRVTASSTFDDAERAIREELADVGFGILTEVDMAATLKAKLGVDIPRQKILGACNPQFAHRATQADPSIAALLPCSVVVREIDEGTTLLEAFDPAAMARLSPSSSEIAAIAGDVRELLASALDKAANR